MPRTIPSAAIIVQEALQSEPDADVNALHSKTFQIMIDHRTRYYEDRVNSLLMALNLASDVRDKVKNKLLEPIVVEGKSYSNFMEEVSRRVSQAFQPISGNIAELCAERELLKYGLKEGVQYTRKKERTDLIVYSPSLQASEKRHRVEVKNVSLRERATRGLSFDGDSLFGFFNQLGEFTRSNVEVLDELCKKSSGFCYLPPSLLSKLRFKGERFRPNIRFGEDMNRFVRSGDLT